VYAFLNEVDHLRMLRVTRNPDFFLIQNQIRGKFWNPDPTFS